MKRVVCIVLLLSAVALCAGCAISSEPTVYTSTARIKLALPQADVDELIGIYLIGDVDALIKSDAVLIEVIDGEKLSCTVDALSEMIRVWREPGTESVYCISVDTSVENDAVRIANAVATEFCKRVNRIYAPDEPSEPIAEVLGKATAPTAPK